MPRDEISLTTIVIGLIPLEELERFDNAVAAAYGSKYMRSHALRAIIKAVGDGRISIKPQAAEPEFQVLTEAKSSDKKK